MNKADVLIIGAGASGLAAACVAEGRVILLEKEARVGRKLMATGNGRCNLLNLSGFSENYHGSGAALAKALLLQTSPESLLAFFESLGLVCTADSAGRVYPLSGQAGSVLDVLRFACARRGVDTRCDTAVRDIQPVPGGFHVSAENGETFFAPRVIVSTGGAAAPSLGADTGVLRLLEKMGHRISAMRPALSPLRLPAEKIRGLKGVRAACTLSLLSGGKVLREEKGEALFTDYGISGIAAMQMARQSGELLSRHKPALLSVRLLEEDPHEMCLKRANLFSGMNLEDFFTGLLHKRIGLALLKEAGLSPADPVDVSAARRIAPLLSDWRLPVLGVEPFAHSQVTSGGLTAENVDPETLESRLFPGLHICGEALDVDGDCGGYNLMWAWVSGITAGKACARSQA